MGTETTTHARAAAGSVEGFDPIGFHIVSGRGPESDRVVLYRSTRGADGPSIEVTDRSGADAEADLSCASTVVRLDSDSWEQLTAQVRTFINLFLSDALTIERGGFDDLARWDPALRFLHAGIPVYVPGRVDLSDADPMRAMTLDATDDELRSQLQLMGYLHVRAVFTPEEVDAANHEIDRLASMARKGDDQSWWVSDEDGNDIVCRLVYATQRSEVLAALESDPRIDRLGRLLDESLRLAPDRMEGAAVLLKAPGRTSGLSNIPWHQDCGMGGHRILCPATSIGIQITGSSAETGNLQVVPGSHGQTLPYGWGELVEGVPVVSIDTEPGDVTVHIQDVMHASPRPTGRGGRRTMYLTFYPPTLWDHVGAGEAFNDLVRNRTDQVAELA